MTLGISVYVFAMYDYQAGGLQFDLQYPWIENVGFFGENGISLHALITLAELQATQEVAP